MKNNIKKMKQNVQNVFRLFLPRNKTTEQIKRKFSIHIGIDLMSWKSILGTG